MNNKDISEKMQAVNAQRKLVTIEQYVRFIMVPKERSSLKNLTLESPNEKIHLNRPVPKQFGFHIPEQLDEEKE